VASQVSIGGFVEVRSGASGSVLRHIAGSHGDCFGASVDGGQDVDLDGTPDLAIGAPQSSFNWFTPGYARVVSGKTGGALRTWSGTISKGRFGSQVRFIGDADGDGVSDLAVSEINGGVVSGNAGAAFVFSGATPTTLFHLMGTSVGERLGGQLAGPGDIDGDGLADLVFTTSGFDLPTILDVGAVTAVNVSTGQTLWSVPGTVPEARFGIALGVAGDVDGDGRSDLVASATSTFAPSDAQLTVVSGASGVPLSNKNVANAPSWFIVAVEGAGDVNGDGFPELVASAPYDMGATHGAVTIETFVCGAAVSLGAPCAPAPTWPQLTMSGCSAGAAAMTLSIDAGVPNAPTILCASTNPVQVGVGGGCSWFVGTPFVAVGPFPLGPTGALAAPVNIPAYLQQISFVMQAAIADPNATTGFELTDALLVMLP
jgi:hypothetical protein